MLILWWLLGLVCGSIPTLNAHPVPSLLVSGPHGAAAESYLSGWQKYMFGLFTVVVTFTLIGCMCCKRHRHPKGFQVQSVNQQPRCRLMLDTNHCTSDISPQL